jgi:hypothetical protein
MRRRPQRERAADFPALDSFMDIVTNVMGALFFVVVYAALSSFSAKGIVFTPKVSEGETERVIFECRGNTVLYPDVDGLIQRSNEEWRRIGSDEPVTGWDRVSRINQRKLGNRFYRYELTVGVYDGRYYGTDLLIPLLDQLGESGAEIELERDSEYGKHLSRLDRTKQHVFFLVRDDSFEVFQTARRIALKRGFGVGWEPWGSSDTLRFSGGGPGIHLPTGPQGQGAGI